MKTPFTKQILEFLYDKCKEYIKTRIDEITTGYADEVKDLELFRFEVDHLRNVPGGVPLDVQIFRAFLRYLRHRLSLYYTQEQIDEIVADTKSELEQDIADTKSELEQDIADTKSELEQDIADTKSELEQDIADTKSELEQDIADTKSELEQDIADLEDKIEALDDDIKQRKTLFAIYDREATVGSEFYIRILASTADDDSEETNALTISNLSNCTLVSAKYVNSGWDVIVIPTDTTFGLTVTANDNSRTLSFEAEDSQLTWSDGTTTATITSDGESSATLITSNFSIG